MQYGSGVPESGSKGTLRILFDRQKGKDRMEYIGNKKKKAVL